MTALHFWRQWRLKRMYREDQRFKNTHPPIKITIKDDEWDVDTANAKARYKWSTFTRLVETDTLYLFYHSPLLFNTIPKRDLTTPQQAQLKAFLDRKMPLRKGRLQIPADPQPSQ